ncbi:hypothetical protein V8D89_000610 [Ganoderma adspersum]
MYAVPMSPQIGVQFAFTFECQHGYDTIPGPVAWTNSELAPRAAYNTADRRWAVTVARAGVAPGFERGAAFAGQRAVVVGAGSSAAEVCEALAPAGAASVTMVQHAPTRGVARGRPDRGPGLPVRVRWVRAAEEDCDHWDHWQTAAWGSNTELYEKLRTGRGEPAGFERFGAPTLYEE